MASVAAPAEPRPRPSLRDLNSAAVWAGITTFIFFVFGALTVQISVVQQFGISEDQQSSWITITWLTSGLVTLPVCLYYRQPISIGWTLPGLLYIGSLADRFTLGEVALASAIAGLAIVAIGLAGYGSRIIHLIPMPVLMAMFAASIVQYVTGMVESTVGDTLIAAPMVAAYIAGRVLANPRVPPVGLAVIAGAVAIVALGEVGSLEVHSGLPHLEVVDFAFSPEALLSVTLPMVVLVLGLGNVQSLGFMISEGYRPPLNLVTGIIGGMTVVNAMFGGHPAAMARTGTAMVSGRDAGPFDSRYWAAFVAFVPVLGVALATGLVVALISILPPAYVLTMAGLAILAAFQDSLERAFTGSLRFGAVVAFAVTMSSFEVEGIPSAFWALIAGIGASFLLERQELFRYWKQVFSAPHSPLDHVVESMEIRRWETETA
ncbi:MAG TPA: benzoate/H(+) symporter BenE family transporter [Dehalococcoidia bacterium]|nr:benzoate/H(+) symporter BenE family transporter [Dehalococcoidia bacterium]